MPTPSEKDALLNVTTSKQRQGTNDTERDEAVARLRSVIDHAPIVLWAVDRDGRFTLSEGRGLKALGLRPGQVVGVSAFDVYAANPNIVKALRDALAGNDVEVVFTEGGRTFENRIAPIRRADNHVTEVLGVSIDVTERHEAERERTSLQVQLQQAQKLESLGLLAGGIAHDFNNILTIILGGASTALASLPPDVGPARQDLETVLAAARRAADLTRQLLAYSGKAHFEIRAVDMSQQIREMATLLEATMPKRAELRLQLDSSLPSIEADVVQLQQIMMNLVINGAEAIGEDQGIVTMRTGTESIQADRDLGLFSVDGVEPGPYVFLEVEDTGSGMDNLTKAKIFDPFFTTKFTGRGLGLATVLGIVRAHRGTLSVHSERGKGTRFRAYFPAVPGSAISEPTKDSSSAAGTGLVLLIDDDKGVRTATRRMLDFLGFGVLEAESGPRGLELFRLRHRDVHVVILDMTMPEMSGEETFHELRKIRENVAVVLTSGYDEQEATRRFTGQGLAGFLQKPYTTVELSATLARTAARRLEAP